MSLSSDMFRSRILLAVAGSLGLVAQVSLAQTGSQKSSSSRPLSRDDPDMQAMRNYKLSMDKLDRWAVSNRAVAVYIKAHPEVKKPGATDIGDAKTFSEMERRARAEAPGYVKALESSGLSFREWWLVMGSLMPAYVAAQYERPGMPPAKDVLPENIAFVKANKQKITDLFAEFQKMNVDAKSDKDDGN